MTQTLQWMSQEASKHDSGLALGTHNDAGAKSREPDSSSQVEEGRGHHRDRGRHRDRNGTSPFGDSHNWGAAGLLRRGREDLHPYPGNAA